MEKSQSSLHKAFYNGGVVDIPPDYPHDSAVLISADGNTKFSVQESRNIVETIVVKKEKDKSLKTCKGCTRRYFKILMKTIRILSTGLGKRLRRNSPRRFHGDTITLELTDSSFYFFHFSSWSSTFAIGAIFCCGTGGGTRRSQIKNPGSILRMCIELYECCAMHQ